MIKLKSVIDEYYYCFWILKFMAIFLLMYEFFFKNVIVSNGSNTWIVFNKYYYLKYYIYLIVH